ncbi:hypothetical protein LSH36_86g01007 [Paralvinella palmiformis]|uniref:CRIB domain-containing protein n=1 Tax=Paralvinella palmiformis TaxID=53620 RepID=A0AAD9K2B9_9ANNE|nr:hypothetical protein LSH36_86g01007 [Paralvinella palmiformis]
MASGSMVWFSCCVTRAAPTKRPRIDRTMIGSPSNFRHTAHVGSNDVTENTNCVITIFDANTSATKADVGIPEVAVIAR